jgi:2-phospho-L-lactate guanylyltransferase
MTTAQEQSGARGFERAAPAALIVPIRSFASGKARLAGELDTAERAALARELANRVLDAAGALCTVVVTSDEEVADWAVGRGATVLDDPGSLDGAARVGVTWAAGIGLVRAVIAHADLPFAHDLAELALDGAAPVAVVVPDHRADGTPVLSIPATSDFGFAYGPGSFRRHVAEAQRVGLRVVVQRDQDLGFDIDEPADLEALRARRNR